MILVPLLFTAALADPAAAPDWPAEPIVERFTPGEADSLIPPHKVTVEARDGWVFVTYAMDPGEEKEAGGAFAASEKERTEAPPLPAGPEWSVCLCEMADGVVPEVSITERAVAVTCGRYFVRDNSGQFRMLRQVRGDGEGTAWAVEAALPDGAAGEGWVGLGGARAAIPEAGGWAWARVVPDAAVPEDPDAFDGLTAPADLLMRMTTGEDLADGYGVMGSGGLSRLEIGNEDATLRAEPDLVVADRTPGWAPRAAILWNQRRAARAAARAALAGTVPPPLNLVDVLPAGGETEPADLVGSVVLVDFWATWCGPCKANTPTLIALHERYAGRGLKIVGAHDAASSGVAEYVEENGVPFPTGELTDATTDAYGITFWPTYVLIGRDGRVIGTPDSGVPSAEDVEAALAAGAE